jgi:hypothetical protein
MGFPTRVWYAAGRTAELLYGRTRSRACAGWPNGGGRQLENWDGTDRRVPLFRPTKFAFSSSVTVQLIPCRQARVSPSTLCLSAVRVVGLLNNPRMEPEQRAMCSRLAFAKTVPPP